MTVLANTELERRTRVRRRVPELLRSATVPLGRRLPLGRWLGAVVLGLGLARPEAPSSGLIEAICPQRVARDDAAPASARGWSLELG